MVHNVVDNVGVVPHFIQFTKCSLIDGNVNVVVFYVSVVAFIVVVVVIVVLAVVVFDWAYFNCAKFYVVPVVNTIVAMGRIQPTSQTLAL